MRANCKQRPSQLDCAKRTADCFVRAGVRNKFSMTEKMATNVGKDDIELYREDDQQKDRPVLPIVCNVPKMAERASEESEAEHAQTDALDVAFGLIGDQAADGNQRDCQWKQRNKESIPIIQHRKGD